MNVKRSSSWIAATALVEADGCSALGARLRPPAREVGECEDVVQSGRRARRRRPSPAGPRPRRGRRPTPSARGRRRRPSGAVGVYRCADGTDLGECEVEQCPFEGRSGERRESLALLDAARQEAVREVLDPLCGLGPGDLVPAVAVLDEVGRPSRSPGDGVAPETGDGAVGGHRLAIYSHLACRNRETGADEVRSPESIEESCARPGTDH